MDQLDLFPLPERPERMTVEQGFDLLWRAYLDAKPSGRTYKPNRKAICKSMGGRWMDTISELDVEAHKNARLNGLGFRQVGIGTVFHDHALITLLYAKIASWKRRGINPLGINLSSLTLPSEAPTKGLRKLTAPPRERIISPREFSRLFEHAPDSVKDILIFGIDTGIRISDLEHLRVSDYNSKTGSVEFVQRKIRHKWAGTHVIELSDRCKKIVQKAKDEDKPTILDFTNWLKLWRETRQNAKVKGVQFRDVRKSAANAVNEYRHDPKDAQLLMGHRSVRTTLDHYLFRRSRSIRGGIKFVEKKYC